MEPCALTDPPLPEETPTPPPTPPPTETPTPEPTPAPTCDPDEKPNPKCHCPPPPVPLQDEPRWDCKCDPGETGTAADYTNPSFYNGCPPETYNNGNHCCVCYAIEPSCPAGYSWNPELCKCCDATGRCVDEVGAPSSTGRRRAATATA